MGCACVGSALSDCAGAVRTLLGKAGAQPETPHRLGPPNRAPGTALVSYPHSGGGSRRSLRLTAIAVGLGWTATTYYWHHSPALGCTFVPPCTAAQERDQGPSTPGRIASPCAATGPDSPQDGLAIVDGFQLVWRRSTSSRNRFRHRGLVSHWSAASAHPLGVGARPQRQVRNPRSALHPTRSGSQSNLAMVPLALASRGDLPRSPGSSGSRDTTPVVPPGDCPHHTCVARLVLRHYFVGSSPGVCERTLHSPSRLVPKDATNLLRRHCADTRATLGPLEFPHIPSPPACNQNPALAVFQLVPGGLLCSLMDKVELRNELDYQRADDIVGRYGFIVCVNPVQASHSIGTFNLFRAGSDPEAGCDIAIYCRRKRYCH